MRVYKLTFRTPGIFLDREGNNFNGNIYLELKDRGVWKKPEELGVKVIPEQNFQINSVNSSLATGSLKVPKRDDGILTYNLLMQDAESREYRIVVDNCVECWTLFTESHQGEVLDPTPTGRIVVETGTIPKA